LRFVIILTVYLITPRHEKRIPTEQISGEATAKFLEERKAWKTTGIIIGFVFLSYFVGVAPILADLVSSVKNRAMFISGATLPIHLSY